LKWKIYYRRYFRCDSSHKCSFSNRKSQFRKLICIFSEKTKRMCTSSFDLSYSTVGQARKFFIARWRYKRKQSFIIGLSPEMGHYHQLYNSIILINAKRSNWYLYPCSYKCLAILAKGNTQVLIEMWFQIYVTFNFVTWFKKGYSMVCLLIPELYAQLNLNFIYFFIETSVQNILFTRIL
jgi:hypothetical protein